MTSEEYDAWASMLKSATIITPCHDCLAAFSLSMRAEGRCIDGLGKPGRPRGWEDDDEEDRTPDPEITHRGRLASAKSRHERRLESIRTASMWRSEGFRNKDIAALMGAAESSVSVWLREDVA